jgi:hypothetical protein
VIEQDGVAGIHGVGEADEPPLCPCGKGYVGHGHMDQIARGVRGRQLDRLIPRADERAQRRFRRWLGTDPEDRTRRSALFDAYVEAEDLHADLLRTRVGS